VKCLNIRFGDSNYEDALKEPLRKKQAGQKIEAPKSPMDAKVINLMDALRRSVEAEGGGASAGRRGRGFSRMANGKSDYR